MSTEPVEEHELEIEADPELETPDVPQLPPDLRAILLTQFPPGNKRGSGFAASLVDLMTKADEWNLARLFEAFPVVGVAFMLWDEGLIEYSPNRQDVRWREEHADKSSLFDIESWRERCLTMQNVISYSRTQHNGQTLTDRDLAKAVEFGSY